MVIGLSTARAFAGQEISFFAKFTLDPGWHVYGAPVPEIYTTTSVTFVSLERGILLESISKEKAPKVPWAGECAWDYRHSFPFFQIAQTNDTANTFRPSG
jgi:hypothetical protein